MNKRSIWPPLGVLLLATTLVWTWQYYDYRNFAREVKAADKRYEKLVCDGAVVSLLRPCNLRDISRQDLESTLDDMRRRLGATYLGVYRKDGSPFVQTGKPSAQPALDRLTRCRMPIDLRDIEVRRRAGCGCKTSCSTCTLPKDLMEVHMQYPADRLQDRLVRGRDRFLGISGAVTLALGFLFLFYLSQRRTGDLRAELGVADERVRSLEFLSRLGAGLAHETKNPLGSVRGFGELLMRQELPREEVHRAAERIVNETDRIVARLDEFLLLSRPAKPRMAVFDLKEMLDDLAALIRLELASKQATLEVSGSALRVKADGEQVRRLFMNLLVNAADAVGSEGRILIRLDRDEQGVRVTVEDDGPGIPAELRETLFEPYVSGRPGGTGLGLAIAKRIATEHRWRIHHESVPGGGARMVVEVVPA